jgi:hypothetical protein
MTEPGVNSKDARHKFEDILEIFWAFGPVNVGVLSPKAKQPINTLRGNSLEEISAMLDDFTVLHAVYSDRKKVVSVVERLRIENLGISVVISGLFEEISKIVEENTKPPFFHTLNISLGVYGNTSALPPSNILGITTMCGHGMISSKLVYDRLEKIRSGQMTLKEVASELGRQCVCGIFNKERAEYLLNRCLERE